ncbi:hypothetical protein SAMN05421848_1328 [Kushneria avicenniae]|uniref:Uncharacterized protein n=1 Tax=Kushneria avicenniae TaxID=402385 RepID=A0A1I1J4Y8_9GAMM|nr:hypothetical protein [Kushneria avicenniae]SFC43062.1 hypothetical protein SAMN05421848_1328 [Kushneria avicenniae]
MGILIVYFVVTALAVLAVFAAMGVSANSGHFMEAVEDAYAGGQGETFHRGYQ